MPALKQARAEGKIAFFKYTKLIIKEKMSRPYNEAPKDAVGVASYAGTVGLTRSAAAAGVVG